MAAKDPVAKTSDGTVQITFDLPWSEVAKAQDEVLVKLGKDVEVAGFRKGKAPKAKVKQAIGEDKLIRETLNVLLPKKLSETITKNKIKPAVYPRLDVLKANDGEDWQIRATTCELPEIELGDYKKIVAAAGRASNLWTPDKGDPKKKKEPSREEKEQEAIKILLETIKFDVPKLLVDEEVNSRLSSLLARIEKLGLSLEGYLASIGKTPETIREEYANQARESLRLELILNKIASEEKIDPKEEQIDDMIKAASENEEARKRLETPEQRNYIRTILSRRMVLEHLAALI